MWFENKFGRKFPATPILEKHARKMGLVPCEAPAEDKPAAKKPAPARKAAASK